MICIHLDVFQFNELLLDVSFKCSLLLHTTRKPSFAQLVIFCTHVSNDAWPPLFMRGMKQGSHLKCRCINIPYPFVTPINMCVLITLDLHSTWRYSFISFGKGKVYEEHFVRCKKLTQQLEHEEEDEIAQNAPEWCKYKSTGCWQEESRIRG